ncbi:hypothetical protein FRC03_008008 [Tulasnella sp. 419]|nr:hypothetical protein FRC03_008008 [Tulasnella sp. 419]
MSSPSSSIKAKEKQRWRDKILPSSSKAKEVGGEVSGALITTLTIAKESLDGVPVPGLKAAVGGVLEVIKTIKKSESNAEEIEQLRVHVENLMNLVINPVKDAKNTDFLQARINKLTAYESYHATPMTTMLTTSTMNAGISSISNRITRKCRRWAVCVKSWPCMIMRIPSSA